MSQYPEKIVISDQYNIETLLEIIEQKDDLLRVQQCQIEQMQKELYGLKKERDLLIAKINQLMMDINSEKLKTDARCYQKPTDFNPKLFPRSHSIDQGPAYSSFSSQSPKSPHTRQQSISGSVSFQRQKLKKPDEDGIIKRSRIFTNAYELSQDLQDKQVEMLERKYGGRLRARHAALVIQRAFRKYCMDKKFQDLRTAKVEKRLSNRFHTIDLGQREWTSKSSNNTNVDISFFKEDSESESLRPESSHISKKSYEYIIHSKERERHSNKRSNTEIQQNFCLRDKYPLTRARGIELTESLENNKDTGTENHTVDENTNNKKILLVTLPESSDITENSSVTSQEIENIDFENFALIKETAILEDNSDNSSVKNYSLLTSSSLSDEKQDISLSWKNSSVENSFISSRESPHYVNACKSPHQIIVSPAIENMAEEFSYNNTNSHEGNNPNFEQFSSDCPPSGKISCPIINVEDSPIWKRKSQLMPENAVAKPSELNRLSNISEDSEGSADGTGYSSSPTLDHISNFGDDYQRSSMIQSSDSQIMQVSEVQRKRQYRVGLNLFNKKPEKGIKYLMQKQFIENSPQTVARFLISRKGLSKQMIGEYLGNLQNAFNMTVLEYFVREIDLCGMQVDVALRKFQSHFRLPGEAQKIERLMEAFGHRFCVCNPAVVSKFRSADTVFILAFAIIMLNTDLHSPNVKPDRRMKLEDFIKNLRGIDDGSDIDKDMLVGIYERIKLCEFKAGTDHVTQIMKVEKNIVGKRPLLALPHRRLVCYCRLFEVHDPNKKERPGIHQREVFLFNDLLVVTKIFSKKKGSVTYNFRQSLTLCGMHVTLFETPNCSHGIHLVNKVDNKIMITFNARNEHDRSKFVEDLKESIYEMDEMENLRIEGELERQKMVRSRTAENRDSGLVDMEETVSADGKEGKLPIDITGLKRSALSNSLLDIHEQTGLSVRRGSAGSLDSGMVSELSTTSSTSRDSSPQNHKTKHQQPTFKIGAFFTKKGKSSSKSTLKPTSDSTEV